VCIAARPQTSVERKIYYIFCALGFLFLISTFCVQTPDAVPRPPSVEDSMPPSGALHIADIPTETNARLRAGETKKANV
jgi:hypothetical protein